FSSPADEVLVVTINCYQVGTPDGQIGSPYTTYITSCPHEWTWPVKGVLPSANLSPPKSSTPISSHVLESQLPSCFFSHHRAIPLDKSPRPGHLPMILDEFRMRNCIAVQKEKVIAFCASDCLVKNSRATKSLFRLPDVFRADALPG